MALVLTTIRRAATAIGIDRPRMVGRLCMTTWVCEALWTSVRTWNAAWIRVVGQAGFEACISIMTAWRTPPSGQTTGTTAEQELPFTTCRT
jgi:hypothetical protein